MKDGGDRIWFLDYLRALIVLLVLLHHSLLAYTPAGSAGWPVIAPHRLRLFDGILLVNDIFMMPVLFFTAGFFAIPSLRKGTGAFLLGKTRRLFLPLLAGVFLLRAAPQGPSPKGGSSSSPWSRQEDTSWWA